MNWIKLVNYGDYPHDKGLQRITPLSAKKIIESFYSLKGKIIRKFCGLPIYIGHPDDGEYKTNSSKIAYGRINDVKCDSKGLWMSIDWSELGSKIFSNGMLKHFSPRWLMKEVSDGLFEPQRLLSVGLTNHPNIKCNHESVDDDSICYNLLDKILKILEIDKLSSENDVLDKVNTLKSKEADSSSIQNLEQSKEKFTTKDADENTKIDSSTTLGDSDGDNCPTIKTEDKENKIRLKTKSITDELISRDDTVSVKERILKIVYDRMSQMNETYHTAWVNTKIQYPELFK